MPDSSGSHALVLRLQEGDESALVELFERYRERLKRMVHFRMDRRLQGRIDASDVLQEAFMDANQRVRHFLKKPELTFFIWLRHVTTQRLIDVHRRHLQAQKRDAKQELSINRGDLSGATSASMAIHLIGRFSTPSQLAIRAEQVAQVEASLQEMDDIDREVLALRHFEELTNNEVAEVLGLSKAAASNRYVRALTRLRSILEKLPGFLGEADSSSLQ